MLIFYIFLVITTSFASSEKNHYLSENFINSINQKQSQWIAGKNFPEDISFQQLKVNSKIQIPPKIPQNSRRRRSINEDIPEFFDSKTNWPQCADVINEIRDQGQCATASWVFSVSEVATDRLCIESGGKIKFLFSPEDILSCCSQCGNCTQFTTVWGWSYLPKYGVVSGGDYNSSTGCKPYSQSAYVNGVKATCQDSCTNPQYSVPYSENRREISTVTPVDYREEQIQLEIMKNGPVQAYLQVYADFLNYKSGVYSHTTKEVIGDLYVKIVGWGVEGGTKYWYVANAWGKQWGDLGGFFKIIRGVNEGMIELIVYALEVLPSGSTTTTISTTSTTSTITSTTTPSTTTPRSTSFRHSANCTMLLILLSYYICRY